MALFEPVVSATDIANLRAAFRFFDADNSGEVSVEDLSRSVGSKLGRKLDEQTLLALIREVSLDQGDLKTFDHYDLIAYAMSKRVDRLSRLESVFSVLDMNGDGRVTKDMMRTVMRATDISDRELDLVFTETDPNGNGWIDFEQFCKPIHDYYTLFKSLKEPASQVTDTLPSRADSDRPSGTLQHAESDVETKIPTPDISPGVSLGKDGGSSVLQMQIGLFRLIQGAAYRCFRTSFSANHETHLPVRNLPYRIADFVKFVDSAIALYKGLGIVSTECHPVLDALVFSVRDEYQRLIHRIANWQALDKTPEMLDEARAMAGAGHDSINARAAFVAAVEVILSAQKNQLEFIDLINEVLARNELHRLQDDETLAELALAVVSKATDVKAYLRQWHRVILHDSGEVIEGAMMPVAYWYEDFMPKLLMAFSVSSAADLDANSLSNEAGLQHWFDVTQAAGEFARHGSYIPKVFDGCAPAEKLRLQQSWRLARHYLNGVQKRRERQEFGRESGVLSQYVAFIDVYLGLDFVRQADMRLSFPYYIGPAVWRFLHTAAEIVDASPMASQAPLTENFKDFFRLFASQYPCPYCRHHLNAYVVQNREVEMYPVEYLLLGRAADSAELKTSVDDKLSAVVDGASMRLYLWKLHNTVSSSIARSEEWYHSDDHAFYTTRYWPSIDSELALASARGQTTVRADRIQTLYGLFKPVSRLSYLRMEIQSHLASQNQQGLIETFTRAKRHIEELDDTVIRSGFLQHSYAFDPSLTDQDPHFTPEEEAFGRSASFVSV
ncbi:MAG: EF-hand domain-containing protein [Burkholderiales bacterium]